MSPLPVVLALAIAAAQPDAPGVQGGRDAAFEAARAAGEAAFQERDDPARRSDAIARFREAAELRPDDATVLLALARAQAFRALAGDDAEARAAWPECARAAERALRVVSPAFASSTERGEDLARALAQVDARGAAPLYWWALGTMGFAQARGLSAVLAVRDAARAAMQRAAELDERVDFAGPRRALGAWLASLPVAAGGGAAAARAQLDRARSLFPAYQLTAVREAETLAVLVQDRARFEALLNGVLASTDAGAPEIAPENRLARRRARSLLARRDRLF